MRLFETLRDKTVGVLVGFGVGGEGLRLAHEAHEEERVKAKESLADLELALDDAGWREMLNYGRWNFTRLHVRKLMALSRVMYLINPLIRRAVTVQELYVWGSGCEIRAQDKSVQEVLDDFFTHPKNQEIIGAKWPERERDQRIDGNTFFCFHLNRTNGSARVRLMLPDEVEDVICNPEDVKEPWYYRRVLVGIDTTGAIQPINPIGPAKLYPDINYNPRVKPKFYGETEVDWTTRVLHVKTGGLSQMKFGLPELYSTLNWATAYKKILENFATILAAYARMAMKMTGLAGAKGNAAAKSKLNTGITSGSAGGDRNPPTNTASWMMLSGNVDVAPIKTAHSTTAPDEARALRSMVAAGSDTPEHFFGDSDIGNFATSTTLDRPTELKMVARQDLWRNVILEMSRNLIVWSAQAPRGKLRQADYMFQAISDPFDGSLMPTVTPPRDGSLQVTVTFPSILERDVTDRVRAVVLAATLNGRHAEGIIPSRQLLFKLLMVALGEKDAEELMQKYYPKDVVQGFADPAEELAIKKEEADAMMLAAQNKSSDIPKAKDNAA